MKNFLIFIVLATSCNTNIYYKEMNVYIHKSPKALVNIKGSELVDVLKGNKQEAKPKVIITSKATPRQWIRISHS